MTSAPSATTRIAGVLAALAVLCGIWFRFASLGAPSFWQDEQYTSLYATGHYDRDVRHLFDGRPHDWNAIARFSTIEPHSSVRDVVAALREEDPQHPPAFYLLEHAMVVAIGSSIVDFRVLPALLGTLGVALAFVLARRLFASTTVAAIAAALFALSPIFVLYSRQAREYSLFVDDIFVASIALLAALDPRSSSALRAAGAWTIYAATLAFGLYTHPLFSIVIGAHLVTTAIEPGRRRRHLTGFALAALAAVAAYLPWVSHTVHENLDWAAVPYPPLYVIEKAAFNTGAIAFDAEFIVQRLVPVGAAFALAIGVAAGWFARTGGAARRFVLPLAASAIVATGGRDIVLGSHVSTIPRYLTPSLVGIVIAVAGVLGAGLFARSSRVRRLSLALFALLLAGGVSSAGVRGARATWWDNNDEIPLQRIAAVVNTTPRPLVISAEYRWVPRELALYLRRDATFVLFEPHTGSPPPPLPANGPAFLVAPARDVLAAYLALARGRDDVVNLSPRSESLIVSFHRDVSRHDAALASRHVFDDLRPDESLYEFTPRRHPRS